MKFQNPFFSTRAALTLVSPQPDAALAPLPIYGRRITPFGGPYASEPIA
jgi:hypothetical protein